MSDEVTMPVEKYERLRSENAALRARVAELEKLIEAGRDTYPGVMAYRAGWWREQEEHAKTKASLSLRTAACREREGRLREALETISEMTSDTTKAARDFARAALSTKPEGT